MITARRSNLTWDGEVRLAEVGFLAGLAVRAFMSVGCLHTRRQLHWRCVGIEVAVRSEQCAWMQRAWVLTTLASVSE
eukprot:10543850-Alexandrium_andersonii.AAC.1